MAIATEQFEVGLVRTYSTIGMKVERDGVRYDEAIDPSDKGRVYTETDEPITTEEATESDKDAALTTLGVNMEE